MVGFEPRGMRLEELPEILARREQQAEEPPKLSLEELTRAIRIADWSLRWSHHQRCLVRAFCLAEHWHPDFGRFGVHVGMERGANGRAAGHVWITADGRRMWSTDRRAAARYSVLVASKDRLSYWYRPGSEDP